MASRTRSRFGCGIALAVLTMAGCSSGAATDTPTLPASDRPGFKFVFFQEFNTPAPLGTFLDTYGASFNAYPYPLQDTSRNSRGQASGYYYPEKTLSVVDGKLDSWLHYDPSLGRYLVSAVLPKLPTKTSGKFVIRMRADVIPGYKVVPLLWPDSEVWPDDGEINFPEGELTGEDFKAYLHYADPKGGQQEFTAGVNGSDWHVYETDWSPGRVEFLVDGESIGSSTNSVPTNPMHWVFQFETNIAGPAPAQSAQGHVQVDWAKVYQPE